MNDEITLRAIVPATPGGSVVEFVEGTDDAVCLCYEPIIAWDVERREGKYDPAAKKPLGERFIFHTVWPLTVNGNADNVGNLKALKRPDSTFEVMLTGEQCETEAELIEAFKALLAELRQREAKRAAKMETRS
jgi:hypothetical protein